MIIGSTLRNFAKSFIIVKKLYYKLVSNTYYWQKKVWKNKIKNSSIDSVKLYGYEWGDPDSTEAFEYRSENEKDILGNYAKIKNEYLIPFVKNDTVILELGSLGGKWTQFLIKAKEVICVDINENGFDYIKNKLPFENISFYLSKGNELKGIESQSIDMIFSIDTLVRVNKKFINDYFSEFARVLKPNGKLLIHLPCDEIKGSLDRNFVNLNRKDILELCIKNGFEQFEIDDKTIHHGVILKCNYNS